MPSTITISFAPDTSLGLATVSLSTPIEDPTDYEVFLACFKDMLRVGWSTVDGQEVYTEPSHEDIVRAFAQSVMNGARNNVANWVKQQKLAAVTVTVPELTVS
jgi:hypothetical protein